MAEMSDAEFGVAGVRAPAAPPAPSGEHLPLGIRQNNPGNIRGARGFRQYSSMEEGVTAADKLLQRYGSKHGLDTVEGVVNRWAPPAENDTPAYIRRVQQATGFKPGQKIDLQDELTRGRLRDAMLDHETPGWRQHYSPGKSEMGDADFLGGPAKPKPEEKGGSRFMARIGKDIAGLADMAASIPGGLMQMLTPDPESGVHPNWFYGGMDEKVYDVSAKGAKESAQRRAEAREQVGKYTTSPIANIMHAMGYEKDYSDADVGKATAKVGSWMEQGADWISKQTGGKLSPEAVQQMEQDLLNVAPLGFTKFVRDIRGKIPATEVKAGKVSQGTAADILKRYTEDHGNPEKLDAVGMKDRLDKELTTKSDMEINAEAKAYDLMTRGASLKEVQAARKSNPLVGKKLDEMMARREEHLGGQMSRALPIDAILDPEAAKQLPGPRESNTVPPRPALPPRRGRMGTGRRGQSGKVDPRALMATLAVTGGAALGASLAKDEKFEGALLGGTVGAVASLLPGYASKIGNKWGQALKLGTTTAGVTGGLMYLDKDHPVEGAVLGALWGASHMLPRAKVPMVGKMTLDEIVNARNGAIASQEREIHNVSKAMRETVPNAERRAAVAEAVERGDTRGLSPEEQEVARAYRGFTKSFGDAAKDQGLIKDLVQNYVTHVVEREALPMTKVQEVMDALFGGGEKAVGGARTTSGFIKHRKYSTFQELEKALKDTGLKVKTKDIAELVDIYGRSMNRAIENKRMFDALKVAKEGGEGGRPFILEGDKAPVSYQTINTPQLQGMRVHPDIAPALKFVAESYKPDAIMRGLLGVSLAQKRLATGMSLFHAQNLINAYVGAGGNLLKMPKDIRAALDLYYKGGLGDVVDEGLRAGLKIERPLETDLQSGRRLGQALDNLVNSTLGTKLSAFEKGFGGVEKLQRETFDKLTWDYLHSGLKLSLYTKEFEKALRKHPEMPRAEVARQVASFVNDTFGGLDWYRVATETQSQLGRNIALSALSPKGRAGLQVLMFAPDWTFSTFRAMYKALPGSSTMPLTRSLHQKYVLRTALIWATLMNGYNMQTSGHPIWENKDPTKIEYRDGTTQQIAKHAMEGPEWLLNPRKTALAKLGMPVKEVMDQLMGVEYMTETGRSPPMAGSRMSHLARSALPISIQPGVPGRTFEESAKRSALSAAGMPMFKMSAKEKEAARRERERQRRKKEHTR